MQSATSAHGLFAKNAESSSLLFSGHLHNNRHKCQTKQTVEPAQFTGRWFAITKLLVIETTKPAQPMTKSHTIIRARQVVGNKLMFYLQSHSAWAVQQHVNTRKSFECCIRHRIPHSHHRTCTLKLPPTPLSMLSPIKRNLHDQSTAVCHKNKIRTSVLAHRSWCLRGSRWSVTLISASKECAAPSARAVSPSLAVAHSATPPKMDAAQPVARKTKGGNRHVLLETACTGEAHHTDEKGLGSLGYLAKVEMRCCDATCSGYDPTKCSTGGPSDAVHRYGIQQRRGSTETGCCTLFVLVRSSAGLQLEALQIAVSSIP